MITVEGYGKFAFDGKIWEDIGHVCLKKKYGTDHYNEVPHERGDYGIDGFTDNTSEKRPSRNLIFQFYCPEKNYDEKTLRKKQRDKITSDLQKLAKYQNKIQGLIGKKSKIVRWYLISPEYNNKALFEHCNRKTEEIRKLNLPFINNKYFEVKHKDISFLGDPTIVKSAVIEYYKQRGLNHVDPEEALKMEIQQLKEVITAQKKALKQAETSQAHYEKVNNKLQQDLEKAKSELTREKDTNTYITNTNQMLEKKLRSEKNKTSLHNFWKIFNSTNTA